MQVLYASKSCQLFHPHTHLLDQRIGFAIYTAGRFVHQDNARASCNATSYTQPKLDMTWKFETIQI